MGTMADMFTLLFAFFVLMFSLATMDPAKWDAMGGDKAGAGEAKEAIEEAAEENQTLDEPILVQQELVLPEVSAPSNSAEVQEQQRPDQHPHEPAGAPRPRQPPPQNVLVADALEPEYVHVKGRHQAESE